MSNQPERPIDPVSMRWLEGTARHLAAVIDATIKKGLKRYGFTLFLFSFDGPELTYISNAQREDMVKAVQEWLNRQRSSQRDSTSAENN